MKTIKFIFLSILSICISGLSYCQDVAGIIKEADQLDSSMNDVQAVNKYKEALKIQPSNIYALCKCSELCSMIGGRLKEDKEQQDNYYNAAKDYARQALQVNPLHSDANFVMALAMGREAIRKSGKEKIQAVKDIKKYADLSVKYDRNNYKAWFILGKWYYEINNLNYFERTAVKIFYGSLPPASIEDAIKCLEKSKSLNPGFIMNYLSLAKAYKKDDKEDVARKNLMVMFTLPDKTSDDERIKNEGKELLKKWD
jgi:tetratricopeptide (TPR) repeat protein